MSIAVRSRRLRAPLVVTVAAASLTAHCDDSALPAGGYADGAPIDAAVGAPSDAATDASGSLFDAPACPPRDTLPMNLACAVNGQECEMRVNGQWCPPTFAIPWRCVDHLWRENASWSCNPPPPTDVPRPPSPDRLGVCPVLRPTVGASCEPAETPDRCAYPALDTVCTVDQPDVASCPYPEGRWRIALTVCRRSPCPASPPADGVPCEFPARDDCVYTVECEGAAAEVRAFCIESSREWVTRSLCRSWGRDAGASSDAR